MCDVLLLYEGKRNSTRLHGRNELIMNEVIALCKLRAELKWWKRLPEQQKVSFLKRTMCQALFSVLFLYYLILPSPASGECAIIILLA